LRLPASIRCTTWPRPVRTPSGWTSMSGPSMSGTTTKWSAGCWPMAAAFSVALPTHEACSANGYCTARAPTSCGVAPSRWWSPGRKSGSSHGRRSPTWSPVATAPRSPPHRVGRGPVGRRLEAKVRLIRITNHRSGVAAAAWRSTRTLVSTLAGLGVDSLAEGHRGRRSRPGNPPGSRRPGQPLLIIDAHDHTEIEHPGLGPIALTVVRGSRIRCSSGQRGPGSRCAPLGFVEGCEAG